MKLPFAATALVFLGGVDLAEEGAPVRPATRNDVPQVVGDKACVGLSKVEGEGLILMVDDDPSDPNNRLRPLRVPEECDLPIIYQDPPGDTQADPGSVVSVVLYNPQPPPVWTPPEIVKILELFVLICLGVIIWKLLNNRLPPRLPRARKRDEDLD